MRIARPDDADQLATVFIDAWRDAYRGVVDDAVIDALHHPDVASWLRNLVANTAARTFLAEKNGEVLGFTRFGDDAHEPAARTRLCALRLALRLSPRRRSTPARTSHRRA